MHTVDSDQLSKGFGLTLGSDVYLWIDKAGRDMVARTVVSPSLPQMYMQAAFTADNATATGIMGTGNTSFTGIWVFTDPSLKNNPPPNVINGCYRNPNWGWYLQPLSQEAMIPLVPIFILCASLNSQQWLFDKQMFVMILIGTASFWASRLSNVALGLYDHPDYVGLIGSLAIGLLGNGYARWFKGTAFTVMLSGICLLIPVQSIDLSGIPDEAEWSYIAGRSLGCRWTVGRVQWINWQPRRVHTELAARYTK